MLSKTTSYEVLVSIEALSSRVASSRRWRLTRRGVEQGFATFLNDTSKDLRTIRWRQLLLGVIQYVLPLCIVIGLITSIFMMVFHRGIEYSGPICRFDGNINSLQEPYNPWKSSELLTINLVSGKFSFATAKLIDAIWDLIIGRGGQAILAVISYRVCTQALSRVMESTPISYRAFEAVTLQYGTLESFFKLCRDLSRNEQVQARFTLLGIMLSACLVLVFPTVSSAMTGYNADLEAHVQLPNGSIVHASVFAKVYYLIHDGSRLGSGFYDDYAVVSHDAGDPSLVDPYFCTQEEIWKPTDLVQCRARWLSECSPYAPGVYNSRNDNFTIQWDKTASLQCDLLWRLSEYIFTFGPTGQNATNQTNTSLIIDRRADPWTGTLLNITQQWLDTSTRVQSYWNQSWAILPLGIWYDSDGDVASYPYYDYPSTNMFAIKGVSSDIIMTSDDISGNSTCQQPPLNDGTAVRYQWGFSFQLLTICLIILAAWSITMYVMHMNTYLNSRLVLRQRDLGLRRAILDLAPFYLDNLEGCNVLMEGNSKLGGLIRNDFLGYNELDIAEVVTPRERLAMWWTRFSWKRWARSEWRWLLPFFVFTLFETLSSKIQPFWDPIFGVLPLSGVLLVLAVGRRHKSRWIIMVVFSVLFLILHSIAMSAED